MFVLSLAPNRSLGGMGNHRNRGGYPPHLYKLL